MSDDDAVLNGVSYLLLVGSGAVLLIAMWLLRGGRRLEAAAERLAKDETELDDDGEDAVEEDWEEEELEEAEDDEDMEQVAAVEVEAAVETAAGPAPAQRERQQAERRLGAAAPALSVEPTPKCNDHGQWVSQALALLPP